MKCPLCADGTIEADDLSKIPVKVITRMYPAPTTVIFGEKTDLSGVLSNLEISKHFEHRLSYARLRFDVDLSAEVINIAKADGSSTYELTVDLSVLKEI